ncbi:hypothetical protein VSQ32_01985 [Lachnospiraceae bacterium KK002]
MKVTGYTAGQMFLPDIYNRGNQKNRDITESRKKFSLEKPEEQREREKKSISEENITSETDTDIIVKPDGSRVLVVTVHTGGMETTMSLEISKPTDLPNESREEAERSGQDTGSFSASVSDDKGSETEGQTDM